MESQTPPKYLGQIFFEGSSSVVGVGDESGRGGYRGRLEQHYSHYTHAAMQLQPRPECAFVATYGSGMADRVIGDYALTLADDLDLLPRKVPDGYEPRTVAVLMMGASLLVTLRRNGNDVSQALREYNMALDSVQQACEARAVSTIGLGMPVPNPEFRLLNGAKPDRGVRQTTLDLARDHMQTWAVPHTDFINLDAITDPMIDRATDGAHLNSTGYSKAAAWLIARIDPILGVDSLALVDRDM